MANSEFTSHVIYFMNSISDDISKEEFLKHISNIYDNFKKPIDEKNRKIKKGKEIVNNYKNKRAASNLIKATVKKQFTTLISDKINAAKTLQAVIKRKEPNLLLHRLFETVLVNKYEAIDEIVPTIQAAIKRKLLQ